MKWPCDSVGTLCSFVLAFFIHISSRNESPHTGNETTGPKHRSETARGPGLDTTTGRAAGTSKEEEEKKNMERKRSALAAPLSSPRQSSSEETKWGKKQVARQSQREKNERNLLIQI